MDANGAFPDRVRLPMAFDPASLDADLAELEAATWTPHFVPRNHSGEWSAIPLRAPAGATHPILMLSAHPGVTAFADAPALRRAPALRALLDRLQCPLQTVRLMRLVPGASIHEHCDPGMSAEEGTVRLHVPIRTNAGTCFRLNRRRVAMRAGELWYLRLSDPHSVDNRGDTDRVHLVIDAVMNGWLAGQLAHGTG